MSANLDTDVSSAVTSSPPPSLTDDSSGGAASSAAGQEGGSSNESPVVGDVNAGFEAANNSGQAATQQGDSTLPPSEEDPFKDIPTIDELRVQAEQKVPYAQALLQVREAYDASKSKVTDLESLSAFRPMVEKTTPEQLRTKLDIIDGFFAPLEENGQVLTDQYGVARTTAKPGLEKLLSESPDTFIQIMSEGLAFPVQQGGTLLDFYGQQWLQSKGLNPQNLEQYQEWEKTGAPVANSGVDLSLVPEIYREAFKQLPAKIQNDILNADPEAQEYYLKDAQQKFDDRLSRQTAQQQQQRELQQTVERAGTEFVDTIFKEEYDSTLKSIASQWQSSSDPARDSLQHHAIVNTLVNLTDPRMSGFAEQWLKSLNIAPDPLIPQLAQSVESKARQLKMVEANGDRMRAAQLADALRGERLQLKAKVNGVATLMVKALSVGLQAGEIGLQGAQESRPSITGAMSNGAERRQLANPNDLTDRRNFVDIARRTGMLSGE